MLTHLGRTAGWKWNVMLLLSLMVVAYAGAILVTRAFPSELAPSLHVHHFAISLHIVGAGLALALGPFQFLPRLRSSHPYAHRWMGRLYLLGVLAGGSGGLYLAPFSYGGPVTHLGFGSLAVLWLATGLLAFRAIRTRRIEAHRRWVTLNFALTFAGVALRLWLPGMLAVGVSFDTAYRVVAWLCWIPNLAVATVILLAARPRETATIVPGRELPAPRT
jgi:uncharacterized membrane protein